LTNSVVAWSSTKYYNTPIATLSGITQDTIGAEDKPKSRNYTKLSFGKESHLHFTWPWSREHCLSIKHVHPRIVAIPHPSTNQRNTPSFQPKHNDFNRTHSRCNTKPKHSIMPSFEDLSPELRNMIYELRLISSEPISFDNTGAHVKPPNTPTTVTNHLKDYLPLTQVSRQLREETTAMLFGRNTFKVVLSTKKTPGPLTQVDRQLRSKQSNGVPFEGFDLDSSKTSPGSLTYGDAEAAAWTRVAQEAAISYIQRLTVVIENADSVARWLQLHHLYPDPVDAEEKQAGLFSPKDWYEHTIDVGCHSCNRFTVATWSVDLEQRQVRRTEIRRLLPRYRRFTTVPSPCLKCKKMLKDWGRDYSAEGDVMAREHLLRLVWYDSRVFVVEISQKLIGNLGLRKLTAQKHRPTQNHLPTQTQKRPRTPKLQLHECTATHCHSRFALRQTQEQEGH
jgi:hypothetical protein